MDTRAVVVVVFREERGDEEGPMLSLVLWQVGRFPPMSR